MVGPVAKFLRIHHIGAALEHLEPMQTLLQSLTDVSTDPGRLPPDSTLHVGMFRLDGCAIELMEAAGEDPVITRFLEKRGEGLHHVAFEVDDVRGAMERARQLGLEILGDEPRTGVDGTLVAFVHPRDTHGILIELVEEPDR